jgi:hypothetical protein
MTVRKQVYLALGLLNVALGTAGIFIPLLPTTPFLLLAAFLFARSSQRWHQWLLAHRHLGPYIHAFRTKSGLTRSQKIRIGASITVVMWVSAYFAPIGAVQAMLIVMWAFWTALLWRMKTASPSDPPRMGAAPRYLEVEKPSENAPISQPTRPAPPR